MLQLFASIYLVLAFISTTAFSVPEDANTILNDIEKRGAVTVVSQFKGFLSEIAEDLKQAPLANDAALQARRKEWLDNHIELTKKLDGLVQPAPQSNNKQKIADLLAETENQKVAANQIVYDSRIIDAAHITPNEVYKNLWPIAPSNSNLIWNEARTHVLTVSFMAKASYERFWVPSINPTSKELTLTDRNSWISLVPQLKNMLQEHVRSKSHYSINDRARQILGVPPEKDSTERVYVEVWVKPSDLLRPCPDNRIDDKECTPDYYDRGEDVFATVKDGVNEVVLTTGQVWKDWYLNERQGKYTGQWPFPWTRLGYTLDYKTPAGKIPVGASEYITKGGSRVIVKGAYSPEEYVKLGR